MTKNTKIVDFKTRTHKKSSKFSNLAFLWKPVNVNQDVAEFNTNEQLLNNKFDVLNVETPIIEQYSPQLPISPPPPEEFQFNWIAIEEVEVGLIAKPSDFSCIIRTSLPEKQFDEVVPNLVKKIKV